MNNQRVSIISPVKNGAQFLAECLESILAQTYQNWELLIVNDNSTQPSLPSRAASGGYFGSIRTIGVASPSRIIAPTPPILTPTLPVSTPGIFKLNAFESGSATSGSTNSTFGGSFGGGGGGGGGGSKAIAELAGAELADGAIYTIVVMGRSGSTTNAPSVLLVKHEH